MMICWNNTAGRKVQVDGKELETASRFVYTGTESQEGGSEEDIKSRFGKARAAFSRQA